MTKVPTDQRRRAERAGLTARPRHRAPGAGGSPIDLVLLGLLTESPRNAYDLSKVIRLRNLRSWIRISDASIYRNLLKLADAGHLATRTVRNGSNPEKTVFSITRAGRDHLRRLIRSSAADPVSLHFDFDVWLAHLGHLDAPDARRCLEQLRSRLLEADLELSAMLDDHGTDLPPGVRALMELRREVLAVTGRWLDDYPVDSFGSEP